MLGQNSTLKEIEIKLYVDKNTVEHIYKSALFSKYSQSPWQTKELLNQYVDTDDYALTKAKVALRVRKDNGTYIQTLKARGSSVGGFSEREEIDWYLASPELDISLLKGKYWPKTLEALDKKTLHTIFSTDFVRHYSLFTWHHDGEKAEVEVALDNGIIHAGQKQDSISEVELELKKGSAKAMLAFAIELAKQFPLSPSDSSKAERGYRLLTPQNYCLSDKNLSSELPVEKVSYYLNESQRFWESFLWQPETVKIQQWFKALQSLSILLHELQADTLCQVLEVIKTDWQLVVNKELEDQKLKASEEKANTRWGVFLLMTSLWLLNRA